MEMLLMKFESYLCDEEKSKSTINKYLHDVREMLDFMGQECISKELLIQYRGHLSRRCRARTVNGKLSAINAYLKCMGLEAHKVKFLKVQKKSIWMRNGSDRTGLQTAVGDSQPYRKDPVIFPHAGFVRDRHTNQ